MNTSTPHVSRSAEQGLFTLLLVGLAAMLLRALAIADNLPDPVPTLPVATDTVQVVDTAVIQPETINPDTSYFIQP
jgi:hypothetical protein